MMFHSTYSVCKMHFFQFLCTSLTQGETRFTVAENTSISYHIKTTDRRIMRSITLQKLLRNGWGNTEALTRSLNTPRSQSDQASVKWSGTNVIHRTQRIHCQHPGAGQGQPWRSCGQSCFGCSDLGRWF